jgi:MFS family permease
MAKPATYHGHADGVPNSLTAAGDDARHINARDGHIAPGEIAIGVVIGRASEYFDFFVYAIASVLVFPSVFFPFVDQLQGTLYSFAVFSLAFIARPVGTVIFMAIQRRYSREAKLTLALFMLGLSTAGIAFLPPYAHLGTVALVLLALLRIGQGIALGGSWDGLPSLLALNAPENRRGWYAMLGQLGAPVGFIIAGSLFAYLLSALSDKDFLGSQGRNLVIGALAALASYALFHLVTVFPLSWITLYSLRSVSDFLVVQIIGAAIALVGVVASGLIADRFGRRNTLGSLAVLIAVFSAFVPSLMNGGESGQNLFVLIGFGLLGLSYGQAAGAVTANFPARFRYTGAALTSDLAWLVGAGFAPLVALGLSAHFGLGYVSLYLLSGAVGSLAALSLNRALEIRD